MYIYIYIERERDYIYTHRCWEQRPGAPGKGSQSRSRSGSCYPKILFYNYYYYYYYYYYCCYYYC